MRLPGRYDGVARPIVTYGSDPVLHRPSAPVTVFDSSLRRLLLDMFASMEAADGVGLAANQIGVDARIFVMDCPDAEGRDVVGYVINPVLSLPGPVGDEPADEVTEEGCLSVPGPYAELSRAFRARVDGVDATGKPVTIEATGMAARCLQHEMDHLEGTVYVDLLPEQQRDQLLAEAAGPRGDLPA
jgi:peptide deformylase